MDSLVAKQLELIATKLGVAAELLWSALLKQAVIDAWFIICVLVSAYTILLLTSAFMVWLITRDSKFVKSREFDKTLVCSDTRFILTVLTLVCWAILLGVTPQMVKDVITAIYNPEYYALSKILY